MHTWLNINKNIKFIFLNACFAQGKNLARNKICKFELKPNYKIITDNLEHASKTFYKEIEGVKLAVVNFAENEFASAEQDKAGAHPMNVVQNSRKIMEAKKQADFVLVIIHGGHEHCHYPSPRMVEQYRFCADMGADAVICHHTHCIGGLEEYNGVPIAYSLGNLFCCSSRQPLTSKVGYAVRLTFQPASKKLEINVIPYLQCKGDEEVCLLRGSKLKEVSEMIYRIGREVSDGRYIIEWKKHVDKKYFYCLNDISASPKLFYRTLNRLKLLKFLPIFLSRNKMLIRKNLCSCETHRESLIEILHKYLSD
ncbi:CapA family protein [Sedimentisphaera salicampi]|uniref:CapA family protein n=1 Tax=Sedimentisphaera salicampi TaxID=1941349 RepID=UPI000B9B3507|nr:CapA family protein [Sedimentisphaera salicampi]OXU15574.1 Capsule biosynthesis protein CapA [Sedimentisphaera salicampi]